jgi:hypothetical protein
MRSTLVGRMVSRQGKKNDLNHSAFNLMNNILPFVPAANTPPDSGPSLYSDHMLAELLALQEGMIAQLRLERLRIAATANFLTDMIDHFLKGVIDQHEKAAAMLQTQIDNYTADTTNDGMVVITREDSSDDEIFLAEKHG